MTMKQTENNRTDFPKEHTIDLRNLTTQNVYCNKEYIVPVLTEEIVHVTVKHDKLMVKVIIIQMNNGPIFIAPIIIVVYKINIPVCFCF
jgi:hypothetical protein